MVEGLGMLQGARGRRVVASLIVVLGALASSIAAHPAHAQGPCPNADVRVGASADLPDCRAYEQVSPVDKNASDIVNFELDTTPVSTSGDTVMFRSYGAFAGFPSGGGGLNPDNFYLAIRAGGDWTTSPAMPRPTKPQAARGVYAVTSDLSQSLLQTYTHAFEPDPDPASGSNIYLRDNLDGDTNLLMSIPDLTGIGFAATPDFGHIGFTSTTVLGDEPDVPPFGLKVYDIVGGVPRLISREPGTDLPFASDATLAGYYSGGAATPLSAPGGAGAISEDGTKVFIETPATYDFGPTLSNTALIYRRFDGETELASPSRLTPADPLGPRFKNFRRATPDGDTVFFTSSERLTEDANTGPTRAGSDLYRYDFPTDELIDVSVAPGGDGARVQGVVGVSDDGDRAYYVALGDVAPGGVAGEPNLYLWEDDGTTRGSSRWVATLSASDSRVWATGPERTGRVTRDGRFVVLQSQVSGASEIYHYDADAANGAGLLRCASCDSSSTTPAAPSTVPFGFALPRTISEDGKYVFFNSEEALVPRDTNGKQDVYVWSGGEVALLSTGRSTSASRFLGTSDDGRQAFFTTREALVPQDRDANVDVYAASVGGGLAAQHTVPPPDCQARCQGPGDPTPEAPDPGSSTFRGTGNVESKPARCATANRRVAKTRKEARRMGRLARNATGKRAKRLTTRHKAAKKRYAKAQRTLRQCERGAK